MVLYVVSLCEADQKKKSAPNKARRTRIIAKKNVRFVTEPPTLVFSLHFSLLASEFAALLGRGGQDHSLHNRQI